MVFHRQSMRRASILRLVDARDERYKALEEYIAVRGSQVGSRVTLSSERYK